MNHSKKNVPLYVDLDGTVIKTDLMFESVILLLKKNILYVFAIIFWLIRGRAHLKFELARKTDLSASDLPLNVEFYKYLEGQRKNGREIVLISASNQKAAEVVGEHLGLFDATYGSDKSINLKAERKLQKINELSGGRDFAYAGNSADDLIIWRSAAQVIIVNCHKRIAKLVRATEKIEFDRPPRIARELFKAIRPHQWLKNLLVFVPMILSHQILDLELLALAIITFISFSLCASSIYVLNDLVDLGNDRRHWNKHKRPFASGDLPLPVGFIAGPLMFISGTAVAFALPINFLFIFFFYWLINLVYSFYLKQLLILDVVTLSSLYTLRIIGGAEAISIEATNWLLGFSFFLFLGLALVKRVTELLNVISIGDNDIPGRAYKKNQLTMLSAAGISSSAIAISIFAFYISAPETTELYDAPLVLWAILPLLICLFYRVWKSTLTFKMNEDPVIFALTDRLGQLIVLACGGLLWLAS